MIGICLLPNILVVPNIVMPRNLVKVMMLSKLGADRFGTDTIKNLAEQGVDATHVTQEPGI